MAGNDFALRKEYDKSVVTYNIPYDKINKIMMKLSLTV